jgi:hypothetical protein
VKRLFAVALLALATVPALSTEPALAQPSAAALGKPLESPDLPAGTVSVKVVDGAPSKPVGGTEVTLLVNGTPRIARTGDDGRAMFKDLAPGAKVQAVVIDPDKKELRSEEFPLPGVGVKLMLTISPWNPGGGGGAPMMGGGQGMPNPRQMSGEPRPEQADPAGMFTVRLTYDDFKDAPPVGVPVSLVGYHSDDVIDIQTVASDAEGRAQFKGLDRSGATSYFAMTLLPRDGKLERLISTPAVLDARTGVRLILSGEKRTSGAPSVDDLEKFEKQDSPPPAGKVRVILEGGADAGSTVTMVRVGKGPFGVAKAVDGPPDPSAVQAQADFVTVPAIAAGTVLLTVHGGIGGADKGLEGVTIFVAPAATADTWQGQVDATTGPDGKATVTVAKELQGPFIGIVTINGKTLRTRPFELAASGGTLEVEAHWPSEGKAQADFDVTPKVDEVYYAETSFRGQVYRSLPFQLVPERGTRVSIFVYPRVLFTFSVTSRLDDKYLAVNGRFDVSNNAWAPYVGGPDGLTIPLPKGFTGGVLAPDDQADVAVEPGEGFRLIRPIPPGQKQFRGAFSLPVSDGNVTWNLDLPFGSFNSGMEVLQVPGMHVETPPDVDGRTMTVPQGTFFVLPQINILPKHSMVMKITGLPQAPAWKRWMPRIIGIVVVLILLVGVGAALFRDKDKEEARADRRQQLLDELVELERGGSSSGKAAKRREQILAELETLWDAA